MKNLDHTKDMPVLKYLIGGLLDYGYSKQQVAEELRMTEEDVTYKMGEYGLKELQNISKTNRR